MAILVIDTQYQENYGSPLEPHWKHKGGSSYKVLDIPLDMSYPAIVEASEVAYDGPMCSQTVVNWHVEDDNWQSDFELGQLKWDGEITYPEPTIQYNDIKELVECLVSQQ